jgi:pimeloyl-ACP methyl ester carboxylesterase
MKYLRICATGFLAVAMILVSTACSSHRETTMKINVSCDSLQGLNIPASAIGLPTSGAVIQTAVLVKATEVGNMNGKFCKVTGVIKPVDPESFNMEFEVNLPEYWNRRALQMGGGGYDGSLVTGLTGYTLQPANIDNPLKQGYVTLGGDGGHKSTQAFDGSFALNDEALFNFGKQSIKKVHDTAVEIIRRAYGSEPIRFYFIGGSQGGHEALDAAARYPEDYDGVVSHFPAYNVTMLHLGSLNAGKTLYDNGGAGWMNAAETKSITDAVYTACDKLDGASDGIISNVKRCNTAFDVQKLRCPGGVDSGDTCLSDTQLAAVQQITSEYKPGVEIAGMDAFPKWPLLDGALFRVSTFGTVSQPSNPLSGKEALLYSVGDQTVKYIITRNPNMDTMSFDPKEWEARIKNVAFIMDVTDVSLDRFRAKGGKIILTHGTMDDFITPYNTVAYYERQVQQFSQKTVNEFIRFYMIPGFSHGFGPFNASFDSLKALQAWVEDGQAPGRLVAIDENPGVNRSRPLCEWPTWPKFTGALGTENDAASYNCVQY